MKTKKATARTVNDIASLFLVQALVQEKQRILRRLELLAEADKAGDEELANASLDMIGMVCVLGDVQGTISSKQWKWAMNSSIAAESVDFWERLCYSVSMRLSQYAKHMGVHYKTAFRWWKAGKLDAYQLDTGTVIVRDPVETPTTPTGVALYARVSTAGQKADLERQVERLKTYAASRGYQVTKVVQEIASGMNDNRPKLMKLLTDKQTGMIVIEHRDRLTRFGFAYIEQLLQMQGRHIEVMFPTDTNHDLVDDFIAVITSMASRIYGRRHSKERAEKIKQCVEQVMKQEDHP